MFDNMLREGFAAMKLIIDKKSLDFLDFHIFAKLVDEAYVARKVFAALNKSRVELGLELDLVYDFVESIKECVVVCAVDFDVFVGVILGKSFPTLYDLNPF